MIPCNLRRIASTLNAERTGEDCTIMSITTDSRIVNYGSKCLFIALKGKRFDAHHFASQAVDKGASALLVNYPLPLRVPQLIVADTRQALGQLGAWIRQQVKTRIVALTGSAGKTSVKEMTTAILTQCGCVLATQENFNNDVGVSLTLLHLTQQHDFSVIELGANCLGEIAWSVELIQPDTVLVNNVSAAHLAGFGSLSGVAKAKGEIFSGLSNDGIGILNADSCDWSQWKNLLNDKVIWRFALHTVNNVDFFASNIIDNQWSTQFTLHSPQGTCQVHVPLPGRHHISNALAASALSLSVGATLPAVAAGLAQLKPLPGRIRPIALDNSMGRLLLDDTYNSNVASMIAAAQVLKDMPGYRVMVVGDMLDLGSETIAYHCQVGNFISQISIDKILSIGRLSCFISETSSRGEHFRNAVSLISRLIQLLSEHTVITILVKGSRNSKMECIVHKLQEKAAC
ncbi:UDP-N-acetylmuramoyl-tripeptide--D-alanyl-D-alanine ligase [Candidatus Curculioniphilus buchneri]|uniref:UDP-N-acetylmuramoyl-tripeptide--D-alanyl-D- alanine ligase n=1 Tax=Candidatus Curculioniphilus buchneri TaxID=690594 RepID=UPI00376F00D5